jgi:hypothetical protein
MRVRDEDEIDLTQLLRVGHRPVPLERAQAATEEWIREDPDARDLEQDRGVADESELKDRPAHAIAT